VEALLVTVPSLETEREILRGDVVGICKTGGGGPSTESCGPNRALARSLFRLVGLSKPCRTAGDSGMSEPWDCTEWSRALNRGERSPLASEPEIGQVAMAPPRWS
jgi:hypothetical protein